MFRVVFVTAANKKQERKISSALVKARLCACVNIIDGIESIFYWKGKLDKAREVLLIIKSRKDKITKIIKLVKSMHTYDLPEIISLPVTEGLKPYLNWINESLR